MIPTATQAIVGRQAPSIQFPHEMYVVCRYELQELEVLMRRFGTEQRMSGDEMRDWMNRLHALLSKVEGI